MANLFLKWMGLWWRLTGHPSNEFLMRIMGLSIIVTALIAVATACQPVKLPPLEHAKTPAGITFVHENGSRGKHDLPEIMGAGLALIDIDGDDWLDLYFCNGGPIGATRGTNDPPSRLYRNQRDGTFLDVTSRSNAPGPSYATGTAVGDFDNDGRDDLFVTGWRDQRLYRNLGDGVFVDVTERAGLNSRLWSTSAAFADLDGDGDVDLFVANYVDYDPKTAPYCAAPDGRRDYCSPEAFPAQPDRLYRNEGNGTFTEVGKSAGIDLPEGRGLGVLVADLVGDAKLDIFVANDGTACRLFENLGDLKFRDVAATAGVAFDGQGDPLAAMGVALGDLDGDGLADMVVTNFLGRSSIAFQAKRQGVYADASAILGLNPTRSVLGFGVVLEDFDGDGRLDLLQANGHVLDRARLSEPFTMSPLLLMNRYGQLTREPLEGPPTLGRGLVVADLNHQARPDAIQTSVNGKPLFFGNTSGGRFVCLNLVGKNGQAIGAKLSAEVNGRTLIRQVVAGGSYLSTSSSEIFFGLGDAKQIDRLTITWPTGQVEVRLNLPPGRLILIKN